MAETYVGVSGVGSVEQQRHAERIFLEHEFPAERKLLLGVKATTKIQVEEIESRKGRNWFPVGDELRTALEPSDDSLKVLQLYADDWTDLDGRAIPLIENSLERSDAWVNGLQYDLLPWFTEDSSLQIIESYAHGVRVNGPVVVQCHGNIMQSATPEQLLERLKRIEGFITHILFDASEGRGLQMDPDTLSRWVEVVQNSGLDLSVAIAGGLGGTETASLLTPVLRRFDDISWDAESKLHTGNVLDQHTVNQYLTASKQAVAEGELPRKIAKDIRKIGELSVWLAHIERAPTYLSGRNENDAEHGFMLAKTAVVIAAKYFPELNIGRVSIFANIHDDFEAYTDDMSSLGASPDAMNKKDWRERLAFEQMCIDFAEFPEYLALLEAYEAQEEPEARFIKVLDKSMPTVMNLYNAGKSLIEDQHIYDSGEYTRLADISRTRLAGYEGDMKALVGAREALLDMVRSEVYQNQ